MQSSAVLPESVIIPSLSDAYRYIALLDLTYIVDRLADRKIGWSRRDAVSGVALYKEYLFLIKKYGKSHPMIPPSKTMDEVWHQHILFTQRYHQDCMCIFGEFLHHHPGDLTAASSTNFKNAFQETTQKLYLAEFKKYLNK